VRSFGIKIDGKYMIILQDFTSMPTQEQVKFVRQQGRYLMHRLGQNCFCTLYAVGNFFVELRYDSTSYNMVGIVCIGNPGKLDAYLNTISINELFK
jgi:hypothetical protein